MPGPAPAALATVAALLAVAPAAGHAAVTFYTTQFAFQSVSTTTVEATFEALPGGVNTASPIAQGLINFSSTLNALPFYILKPGNPGDACCTFPHVTSAYLTGNGNEDWDMTFFGGPNTAVGFDYISNNTGITVTVFDGANAQIGATTISTQNVAGYLGIVSTVPIGRVHVFSLELAPPDAQHSAIDNVAIGIEGDLPALPTSWGFLKTTYR